MKARFLALMASAGLALLATLGYTVVRPGPEAAPLPPGAQRITCDDHATHTLAVGALLNNTWNRASAGSGPWQQCLLSRDGADGKPEFGWSWNWPTKDGLYAYPELIVGRSPWRPGRGNDARFPRRLADTRSLRIGYEVELQTSGKLNVATEFWITDAAADPATAGPESIRAELMIWTYASPGLVSSDGPVATVVIDGATWHVHHKAGWGDASGGSAHRWTLISYLAARPTLKTRFDAARFFDDAVARGWLHPQQAVAGVEFGNEIVSGAGSIWVKTFDLTVE